jgi:hypothetical protein
MAGQSEPASDEFPLPRWSTREHDDHAEVLFVFAIIGDWTVGRELDREQLAHIGANVRQRPGFLRGYWGQEEGNTEFAYAVVLFEDEATANMMAEGIRDAIPSAPLRIVRVLAEA